MEEKALLEAISKMIDEKFKPIEQRLDVIGERLDDIEENLSETREGVNTLLGWADDVACVVKIPLKPAN